MASFKAEANILQTIVIVNEVACLKEIYMCLQESWKSKQSLMPNIMRVIKLLLVNPSTPERWLCATMKSKQFNSLAILNVHKEHTQFLDLMEVGNGFIA